MNGDERPDIAYAGDNQGNLWKFDLTSYNASDWGVAFGGAPLFTAQRPAVYGGSGTALPQPITVAPTVRANDRKKCELDTATNECKANTTTAVGGMMVAFGTGRNVATRTRQALPCRPCIRCWTTPATATVPRQVACPSGWRFTPEKPARPGTVKNCLDVAAPKALGAGVTAAKLLKQTTTEVSGSQQATLGQDPLKATNWGSYNGWYLDLPSTGERLLKPLEFYDRRQHPDRVGRRCPPKAAMSMPRSKAARLARWTMNASTAPLSTSWTVPPPASSSWPWPMAPPTSWCAARYTRAPTP